MSCRPRVDSFLWGALILLLSGSYLWADPPAKVDPQSENKSAAADAEESSPSDGQPAAKAKPEKKDQPSINNHLRLKRDINGDPVALQTSIVRYVPASGKGDLVVDLVGVVHVGDPWYYQALNKWFDQYGVVLYELVAPEDRRIPDPEKGSDSPLHMIQKVMQSVLDLRHQLDLVNYRRDNFVHADMSPEQIQKTIAERGDNGITLFLSVTADMLRQQNLKQRELEKNPEKLKALEEQFKDFDPLALMTDEYGSVKLKRMMAEQFADLTGVGSGLGGTLDTILIKDRNGAAMQVFQKQLAEGKKHIAIFYGAAHMPDFERRLTSEFGLKRDKIEWMTAWDLSMRRKSPVEGVLTGVLEEFIRQSLKE